MVAYNFKKQFAEKVRDGSKCQTVRGRRTRHARPGEAIQLYTGQRTKQCEKLIADPICSSVVYYPLGYDTHRASWQKVLDEINEVVSNV